MLHMITWAGKAEAGYADDRNDCVVRAYSLVTGLDYKEAHRLLELWGRKPNKGVVLHTFFKSELQLFPFLWYDRPYKGFTVNHFMQSNPKGKYIVAIKGHAFAVIDGIVLDHCPPSPKARIEFYIRVF